MLIAALLLVATTIRDVRRRPTRREIAIMRLVGASNLFIRLPFLLEGAAAIIGGIIASGMLWVGLHYIVQGWLAPTLGEQLITVGRRSALGRTAPDRPGAPSSRSPPRWSP